MLGIAYWKDRLAGAPALAMPTRLVQRGQFNRQVCREDLVLSGELSKSLRALGETERVSLTVVLLSAFFALISRDSGQDDICLGAQLGLSGVTGTSPESLTVLPLRVHLDARVTFRELLGRVEAITSEAEANRDVALPLLLRELYPDATPSEARLFQLMFVSRDTAFNRNTARQHQVEGSPVDVEMSLITDDRTEALTITLEFDSQVYTVEVARRMLTRYHSVLDAAATDADQQISKIALLTEPDRRQLLIDWNNTARAYPGGFVHQLFEKQAQETPHAVAIVCGDRQVTFSELNSRTNQIAQHLISNAIGAKMRVGICLHRSVDMIAAMFAVLKAGAAYVPLDPEYPPERLRFMIEDASLATVITAQNITMPLPPDQPALRIDAPEVRALLRGPAPDNPTPSTPLEPADPAYIIYTSGSTGKPKGVVIRHAEFTNYISWALALYECDRGTGAPINTSFGFDATITSMYLPLIAGRRVLLLPEDRQLEALAELLASGAELTLVKLTPAHLEALRALLGPKAADVRARCFVVGGEALPRHLATFWREHCPALRIFNEYGPTETVVGCCVYELGPRIEFQGDVPIGRPTPNTRLYVLDEAKEPVPIGVTGELYIGGDQVGAGYLHRLELTAERFLQDPHSMRQDGRMYRTGDLARWRPDGILEFLGRGDDQVKIRGFRVELGEIETVLSHHPAVQSAAVALREVGSGETQLVAYCVMRRDSDFPSKGIRQFLGEHLPEHMIPQSFVSIKSIPLTPHGKVDRRALPMPAVPSPEPAEGFVEPNTAEELKIAAIWRDVLGLSAIGSHDNFFELGGTSLRAVRILARLRSAFQVNLPLSSILGAPTIAQLAELVRRAEYVAAPQSCLVPIQSEGSLPPLFCVHGIGGNVLSYYALAKNLGNDQPVYGIQARGLDGRSEPLYSLPDMAEHYIQEIRRVQPEGPYYLAGLSLGGLITLEIAHQLSDSGQRVALLAMFDTFPPGMLPGSRVNHWTSRLRKTTRRIQLHARNVWQAGTREVIPYVRARLKTMRRRSRSRLLQVQYELTQKLDVAIPQAFRDVREAGAAAARNYVPRQYAGPCVYFQAQDSPVFGNEERRAMWAQYIPGLVVATVPSDHLAILDEPSVKVVADKLRGWMDQARQLRAVGASASR